MTNSYKVFRVVSRGRRHPEMPSSRVFEAAADHAVQLLASGVTL